jgi:L-alanine-DL-glutamate epimerase-like enolase superfamily enzyme
MNRRSFIRLSGISFAGLAALPALPFESEKSKLKITGVRLVRTRPKHPAPSYTPAPGSWSTQGVEVANPMSIYPEYKPVRALWNPDPGKFGGFTVEISTDKGVKGYGTGGAGGGAVVMEHFTKLLMGKDPFEVERIWDILWRSSMPYGRDGIAINAISGVDLALWDLIGNALDVPVYQLLGGATKDRIPAYCTGNDIEQHLKFGYKRVKLAIPYGPADGHPGLKKNTALVQQTREMVGPDGDVMLDCYMAFTQPYTLDLAQMVAPQRPYWMEEVLQPHDYEGFARMRESIKPIRIATGEHEYTRYGFRQLLEHRSADIWQPDIHWCGGMTELRRIGALAAAYDIPVIPHGGGAFDSVHFIMATTNSPWAETFMPPPGGPDAVYKKFEEEYHVTRGPEGIYVRPSDGPGLGWDIEVDPA